MPPNLYAEIPQKVTVSGDRVFKGVIKVEFFRVGPNPMTGYKKRRLRQRHTESEDQVKTERMHHLQTKQGESPRRRPLTLTSWTCSFPNRRKEISLV